MKANNKTAKLFRRIVIIIAPPPLIKVSEWSDSYRRLSSEASAEPGQWRTSRAPYQRGIMDAVNDAETHTVIVMSSAQVGKSEILLNILGYFIDYDPAPILMLQPTIDLAQAFSKDRIAPMLRDTPALKGKVKDAKSRDSGNTLLHKTFPGGHITIGGANAPAGLASRPIRILLADEVDRYPVSAGTEGDPVNLAAKRTTTFWNKKKVYVSTPTIKDASRIESEYEDSTKEQYCYKCPHCGEYQPLNWGQIKFEDVTMECRACRDRYGEYEWKAQPAEWIPREENAGKRGFHLNELYSPWKRWEEVIDDFEDAKAKGPEVLKVFINTSLGETWEERGETADEEELIKRRERYECDLPDGVLVLTAAVDVQDDRLEVEVVGWGVAKESWGIEYKVFYGDPGQQAVWNQMDDFLGKQWSYGDDSALQLSCTCIDSGGHYTTEVYKFCKAREQRRIFAIKGKGGDGVPFIGKATRTNRQKAALFTIGVDGGKDVVLTRLKEEFEGKPGYCHFPKEQEKGYDADYFKGLTSEKRVIRFYKGRPKFEWVKKSGVRNEPLDLRNYATAALEIFNPNLELLAKQERNGNKYTQKDIKKPVTGTKKRRTISKGVR